MQMLMQLNSIRSKKIDIEALKQKLFTVGYIVFLSEIIMSYSMYGYMDSLHPVFSVVRKISFLIILAKLVLDLYTLEFSKREMIVIIGIGCLLVISALVTKERAFLAYWAFIVAGANVDYRRIIKLSLIVHVICFVIIVSSTYIGILDNIIYYRNQYEKTGLRESLGFHYPSEIAHMFFYTTLMWIYFRQDEIHPLEWIILVVATIFIFVKTDTKNPMALGLIAVICSMIFKYSHFMRTYRSWYTFVAICIVPALIIFIIWASYSYNDDNIFLFNLNKLVSGRILLGNKGLGYCPITLFGRHIVWGTQADGFYFFIDSSYLLILFNYGIAVLTMVAAAAVALGRKIGLKKDIWMLLCVALIAIHSTFDGQLLLLGYNSFIMLYSYLRVDSNKLNKALNDNS